ENNQPVACGGSVVVHNGIVVNDAEIWQRHPELTRRSQVDTEIVAALIDRSMAQHGSLVAAAAPLYREIEGETSIAVVDTRSDHVLLATNTGSLYTISAGDGSLFVFVSEAYIARRIAEKLQEWG